tara:strand:+ start:856 stop:1257 length:402 start_codon:yes stop_codon:yes gene_type:complete
VTPLEIALAYLDSFASGDPDRVAAWVTEDFRNDQMGALGNRFQGKSQYRERLAGFLERFAGLSYTPCDPFATGNRVALPYRMTATDAGHQIAIDGVMIITIRDQLVCARVDYWDGLTYLQQMEMAPGTPDGDA